MVLALPLPTLASSSINRLLCAQNELSQLQRGYKALISQMNTIFWQKLWYIQLEQFLMKYMWSASGLVMVGIPVMYTANARREDGELTLTLTSRSHISTSSILTSTMPKT
jgi:ABC-type uncharacterized transport system fused permease/ATPase subunit